MNTSTESTPSQLTPAQQQAVEHFEGPMLVLAGPGSGKTRVITQRIARLVDRGVHPHQILAITFTNKASKEMAERVEKLLPGKRIWMSTFHKFCARLLREHGRIIGLKSNYTIFDMSDQKQLLREILHEENIDAVTYAPAKILQRISQAKNKMQSAEDYVRGFEEQVGDHIQAIVARVYPVYQKMLLESNAVDFDDMLMHVVTLLHENPEIRHSLDERFRFVLVDEYQDTNRAQYEIVNALSQRHQNLCVTGDPDQSIYGWRGARIQNILQFEKDFPQAVTVKLQENFRSTKSILQVADQLIVHNRFRKQKSLITHNEMGVPVELVRYENGYEEANEIALEIRRMVEAKERAWSDFALFYRVNAMSREMEFAFTRNRIPYQIAGGVAFYDRAEVKDMIAYLRVIENPDDRVALRRIINKPLRQIGKTTQDKLFRWGDMQGINGLDAAKRANEIPTLSKRAVTSLKAFAKMMQEFSLADAGSIADLIKKIIERVGYTRVWEGSHDERDIQKLANVKELTTAAAQYDVLAEEDLTNPENEGPTLQGFLETTSLASDIDSLAEEGGRITMMSLHSAKGLEFPVVYILGVEQNLIPHERALMTGDIRELEEERRLLFVGITRAKERLFLTKTRSREMRGRSLTTIGSEFCDEMELKIVDKTESLFPQKNTPVKKPIESDIKTKLRAIARADDGDKKSLPKLMTGADLLSGKDSSAELPQAFGIGDKVRHPRYGMGTVIDSSGFAKKRKVTVQFDLKDHVHTFSVAHAPLQPVGGK